jgi:hypothetical protein
VALSQLPESKVAMARRKGVTRGAVSLATRPGGALHSALLPGGRIDRVHPAALKWLGEPRLDGGVTASEFAEAAGLRVDEVNRAFGDELRSALIPHGLVGLEKFAEMAGERLAAILTGDPSVLRAATTPSRQIDVGHPAALAYLAARPFPRGADGDPVVPDGFPPLRTVGEDALNVDDPFLRAFMARCLGRVPTDADFGLDGAA